MDIEEIREKQNDLGNLISNLEMTIKDTDIKEVKEELNQILYWVKEEFEEVDKELEQMELAETRQELAERYGEYREMVGF
jgi:DNA repair ATPase RecN